MKPLPTFNTTPLLIEIGPGSLRVLDGERRLEIPLEHGPDGYLTPSSRETLVPALRDFLGSPWHPRRRAVCAIRARGVSLRRIRVPACPPEKLSEILTLQVERELPLSPAELAWGYRATRETALSAKSTGERELLLAAVRRDLIAQYHDVLSACRISPVFTPGILSLQSLCPERSSPHAILDIGCSQCELLDCPEGAPETLRILPFGGRDIDAAIAGKLNVTPDEAERLKVRWSEGRLDDASRAEKIAEAIRSSFRELAALIAPAWHGGVLYLAGRTALLANATSWLEEDLEVATGCRVLQTKKNGSSLSATLSALRSETENGRLDPALALRLSGTGTKTHAGGRTVLQKWVAAAAALALLSFALPFIEPFLRKSSLERDLAQARAAHVAGPEIDDELAFLQYIEARRAPYLIVLHTLGEAAPSGVRFDSLTMNRRGDITFQTTLQNAQQAVEFRSKLIASDVFASVVVEDQRPSPQDSNRLNVRITARCKPAAEIMAIANRPAEVAALSPHNP